MFRQSIEIDAEPAALFALTQDYGRRLDWDPFLKQARLVGGATVAAVGVRAWCVARNGMGMETQYVSFHPPGACAVTMTRGPWCFAEFSGSWRFQTAGQGRTTVAFTYHVVGRPWWITGVLRWVFARDTHRRLEALKLFVERGTHQARDRRTTR